MKKQTNITAEGRDKKFKHEKLSNIIRKNMKEYGTEVAEDRAIQDIRDGMKPSQRRLLWAMCDLRAYANSKTHKCARIVGQAMGAYHPHGDCLDGSTVVPLLSGKRVTLRELCESNAGKKWVLSYDEKNGTMVPAMAHSWRIGQYAKTTYNVKLSNGQALPNCTKNHPFFVKGKGWVKAEDLQAGDAIVGGSFLKNDYLSVQVSGDYVRSVHQLVGNTFYELEEGEVFHHENEDTWDNRPRNIVPLSRADHSEEHSANRNKGLDNGRLAMFSGKSAMRKAIKKKNSLLIGEFNKNQGIHKALNALKLLDSREVGLTQENYEDLIAEKAIYNLTSIATIKANGYSFKELVKLYKNGGLSLNTSKATGLTEGLGKKKEYTSKDGFFTATLGEGKETGGKYRAAKKIGEAIELLAKRGLVFSWENYSKCAAEVLLEVNPDNFKRNLPLVSYTKPSYVKKLFNARQVWEVYTQLPPSICLFVEGIEVVKGKEKPMYDFTVDTYENMAVVTGTKDNTEQFVFAHNSSLYSALVNMVNSDTPIIEGQGNFGSLTDDAAASRYTEARVSKLGMKMLECNEVIDSIPNYSGDMKEPVIFPTRVPLYLLNGGSGIAVGLSCKMPAHNLKEIVEAAKYVIKKGEAATVKGILKRMPAPDYKYAGKILSDEKEIKEVYKTGRGKIRYSCDYTIDRTQKGTVLSITGCCPEFYPDNFLKTMAQLAESGIIESANNSTTKDGGFVIEVYLKSYSIFEKYIKKHLEKSVSYQFYAISREKEESNPEKDISVSIETPNILDIFHTWIDWRRVVETKMQRLYLSRERVKLFRSKCRLDASKNIKIIMDAINQDKIEPRDYLVSKLPYLVELVKKNKKKLAYEGADYIGSQQVFSLKKADQSKINKEIKESIKTIKGIKYNISHIDSVVLKELDNLKPFFIERKLKLKGTYEEQKLKSPSSKDIQILGITSSSKKEIVNMKGKTKLDFYTSTHDSAYVCNTEGKVVKVDAFEFTGKDRNATSVGISPNDCSRFMVLTNKGKISYIDNDNSIIFNTVKLNEGEQVCKFEGIYPKTKLVVYSKNNAIKVIETDNYNSSRRNTYAKSSGTGFKDIKKVIVCYKGCSLLTNKNKLIEPEKVNKKTVILGQVGKTNLVILKSGKKSIESFDKVLSIKSSTIHSVYPISFKGRK